MSRNKKTLIAFIIVAFALFPGCTSWKPLSLPSSIQPVYLGQKITSASTVSSSSVEPVENFKCGLLYEIEESIYSEGEHISVELGGYNEVKDNMATRLNAVLHNDSLRFIADIRVKLEVRTGISVSSVLSAILASWITDNDSNAGFYNSESFQLVGKVYRKKDDSN